MVNWIERMNQIQEKEKQRVVNQQVELVLEEQKKQLEQKQKLQQAERLRNISQKEGTTKILRFFEILDSLQINRALEDIKHQVWQGRGVVTDTKTDTERFIRLAFEYKTTIPEFEKKEWAEVMGKGSEYVEFGGSSTYDIKKQRSKTKVVKECQAVKPSYLEVGISSSISYNSRVAYLYVLDTDVKLSFDDVFYNLAETIGERYRTSRTIQYANTDGTIFKEEPHPTKHSYWDWLIGPETTTSYSIASSHDVYYFTVALPQEPNLEAIGKFTNYGLALSCLLRTSQDKLPSQLK